MIPGVSRELAATSEEWADGTGVFGEFFIEQSKKWAGAKGENAGDFDRARRRNRQCTSRYILTCYRQCAAELHGPTPFVEENDGKRRRVPRV